MQRSILTKDGKEEFSGEVVALPVHFNRTRSIHEQIREMILAMKNVEREGYETFEDADDFNVGDDIDDFDNLPNYEADFDHLPEVSSSSSEKKEERGNTEVKNSSVPDDVSE